MLEVAPLLHYCRARVSLQCCQQLTVMMMMSHDFAAAAFHTGLLVKGTLLQQQQLLFCPLLLLLLLPLQLLYRCRFFSATTIIITINKIFNYTVYCSIKQSRHWQWAQAQSVVVADRRNSRRRWKLTKWNSLWSKEEWEWEKDVLTRGQAKVRRWWRTAEIELLIIILLAKKAVDEAKWKAI